MTRYLMVTGTGRCYAFVPEDVSDGRCGYICSVEWPMRCSKHSHIPETEEEKKLWAEAVKTNPNIAFERT